MMRLYELTTGWIGESYERLYAWADNETLARAMAETKLAGTDRKIIRVRELLDSEDIAFCTDPSDIGWP